MSEFRRQFHLHTLMNARILLFVLALVSAFVGGGWAVYQFLKPKADVRPTENASILLDKVREVFKLTTVEGEFSEVYSYNQYSGYFSWFWDKKALLRVNATVAVGYDLQNLKIEVDSAARIVRIGPLPSPQILSIDHTVDYYDVSTGLFESFSAQDLSYINQRAKELIREAALKSNLMTVAETQSEKVFDIVRFIAEGAGWQVEIIREPQKTTPPLGR